MNAYLCKFSTGTNDTKRISPEQLKGDDWALIQRVLPWVILWAIEGYLQ